MKLIVDQIFKVYESESGIMDINFSANAGQCIGLIGPNGAGKTTLLRVIATILTPDSGKVVYDESNIHENQLSFRERMGYMPEDAGLYKKYSAQANLEFYSKFYKNVEKEEILIHMDNFDISTGKNVGSFSKGMVQKVLFIKAIFHNPQILLLDEPLNTLDPNIRIKVKENLGRYINEGKIIIVSSHVLGELEEICNRFIMLKSGKIVADVNKNTLKNDLSLEDLYKEVML